MKYCYKVIVGTEGHRENWIKFVIAKTATEAIEKTKKHWSVEFNEDSDFITSVELLNIIHISD